MIDFSIPGTFVQRNCAKGTHPPLHVQINYQVKPFETQEPDPFGQTKESYGSIDLRIIFYQGAIGTPDKPNDERIRMLFPQISDDGFTSNYVTKILQQTYADDRDFTPPEASQEHYPSNLDDINHKARAQIRGVALPMRGDLSDRG